MAQNPPDNIIPTSSKEEASIKKQGYMEGLEGPPTRDSGKFPFKAGSLVKGRSVKVSADAPKEETTSMPSGSLFTPDKSPVGPSIRDKSE